MKYLSLKIVFIALLFSATGQNGIGDDRPNVILIITDDQGYGDLSCHGDPVLKTPNMDALWADSVRLTDFHVSPLCAPTRAALMTGRHSRSVGVIGTDGCQQQMATDSVTMAQVFKANGYNTGIFGKWHLGEHYPRRPRDRGFDREVKHIAGSVTQTGDYWGNDFFDDMYLDNGQARQYEGYLTDVCFEEAAQFIEASKDKPFFCYLATNAPHAPFLVADKYNKPYSGNSKVVSSRYYGMIANIDENLGRLRSKLRERGVEKDTVLIFMSDNGASYGSVSLKKGSATPLRGFNAGMRGIKGSPYDGGHRVPFFIHWPGGGLDGGRDIEQLSSHIDVLPTLMDLCQLDYEAQEIAFDGMSLKPLLTGADSAVEDRTIIESFSHGVMTNRWRLVAGRELYDIKADPGQQSDVAEQHPEVVARLRTQLEKYRTSEDLREHRFVVGSDEENPVMLAADDWPKCGFHSGAKLLVYQRSIALAPKVDDVSVIQVARAGTYRFSLRRWPRETQTPINALLPKEKWCQGMTRCVVLDAKEALIRVGDVERRQAVTDVMQEAEFTLELAAGRTTLQTQFIDNDGQSRGAYFLYVERLITLPGASQNEK